MEINKLTMVDLVDNKEWMRAVVVYKETNWEEDYSLESRSYRIERDNKFFQENKISNSLYGNCLDGCDFGVRLDWYNWEVDYCYILE